MSTKNIMLDSWKYCQKEKGLEIYGWCIMTSHVHMIIGTHGEKLEDIMRDVKKNTSTQLKKAIQNHRGESRREWLLGMMETVGKRNSQNLNFQLWQQDNHPIAWPTYKILHQKLDYTHNNPVEAGLVDKTDDYFPYGSIAQNGGNLSYRYDYQGAYAEKDPITNWNNFQLRMYDGKVGRWLTTDPKNQFTSPYEGMGNNPVTGIDPTGGYNPVYDEDGNFLGTDSWGLKGNAIIMNADNFTQGMDHQTAERMDLGLNGLSENALFAESNHFKNLPNRPDYDGFVTISEGIAWAKSHPNLGLNVKTQIYENATPDDYLYLDASKFDFGNLKIENLKPIGDPTQINLFNAHLVNWSSNSSIATTYALGRTVITLLDPNGGVRVENGTWNNYDWDQGGGWFRNTLIDLERTRANLNDSNGFPVYIYGVGHLNRLGH